MEELESLFQRYVKQIGGLIRALQAQLDRYGWIDPATFPSTAKVFNLSIADIRGVVSFYHDFRTTPPSATQVRLCRAEACQALGSRQLYADMQEHLENGEADSPAFELSDVYCLGLCAIGPAVEIDGDIYGRASEAAILARL